MNKNKRNKGKEILQNISDSLDRSPQPQLQRIRKLPISINTSHAMLNAPSVVGKHKLIDTPGTPTILSHLSGTLSGVQNELVSKFGKYRRTILCEHCTNIGCVSITSLRYDSDSDEEENDDMHNRQSLEFQCTLCHYQQSLIHINQALGITTKKIKIITPSPASSISAALPGTPASLVLPQDIAYSE